MSVQVRRRRETAAFLSSFVGAQGELLIDTTNNRVQVHDGVTPGGYPAAGIGDLTGRNAVINGTFAINQRAYTSGTALTAGTYAHDRWKAGAGGGTYTFTQTVPDTTLTITAGTLIQAVDAPNVTATSVWLTWKGTAPARIWQGSASGSYTSGTAVTIGGVVVNALLVSGLTIGTIANIEFSAGTLCLVQLEAALPNAGPTRFERRLSGQEFMLCQRYYWINTALAGGWGTNTSAITVAFTFPSPMRSIPTIAIINANVNGGSALEIGIAQRTIGGISTGVATSAGGRIDITTAAASGTQHLGILEAGALSFNAEL